MIDGEEYIFNQNSIYIPLWWDLDQRWRTNRRKIINIYIPLWWDLDVPWGWGYRAGRRIYIPLWWDLDPGFRRITRRLDQFTFHYGEIWMAGTHSLTVISFEFTFHYGEIWIWSLVSRRTVIINLHSIMVRFGSAGAGAGWVALSDLHSIMVRFGFEVLIALIKILRIYIPLWWDLDFGPGVQRLP